MVTKIITFLFIISTSISAIENKKLYIKNDFFHGWVYSINESQIWEPIGFSGSELSHLFIDSPKHLKTYYEKTRFWLDLDNGAKFFTGVCVGWNLVLGWNASNPKIDWNILCGMLAINIILHSITTQHIDNLALEYNSLEIEEQNVHTNMIKQGITPDTKH